MNMNKQLITLRIIDIARQLGFQINTKPKLVSTCNTYGMWAPPEFKGNFKRYDFKLIFSMENRSKCTAYSVRVQHLLMKDKRVFDLIEEDTGQPVTIAGGEIHDFKYNFSVWLPISENKFSSTTRLDELKNSIEFVLVFEDAEGKRYENIRGLHFRKGNMLKAVSGADTSFSPLSNSKFSSTRYKYLRS